MLKKKKLLLCTLLFCICLCFGCEKAPDADRDRGEKTNSNDLNAEKFVSVQEAQEQVKKLKGRDVEGIAFPEEIVMTGQKEIYDLKLKPWHTENVEELYGPLQSMWEDYNKVDWEGIKAKILPDKRDKQFYAEEKTDEKTGFLYSCNNKGFFSGDSLNDTELDTGSCVKQYDFIWGDSAGTEEKYPMEDGEESIKDAVLYTENKFNQNLSGLEKNKFQYKVQHLYVIKNPENDFYDYNMVIGRVYKDVPAETCSDFLAGQMVCYDKVHCGIHMIAIMRHKDTIDLVNTTGELLEVESEEKNEKIISPLWAAKKMNEEIAHENGMSFSKCGLVYVLVQKNKEAKHKVQDVFQSVNDTTYLRPVWLFATEPISGVYDTMTKDAHGNSVIVDAIDGTLYYYEGNGAY